MKIAILGIKTMPALAGADRVVEKFIEYSDTSLEFYIYLSSIDNKIKLKDKKNLHYIYIPTIKHKYLKAFIFFLLSSIHFLIKGNYDIVHIHNSDFGFFNFLIWIKRKIKIVGTFHGNPYLREKWGRFARLYLRFSEKLFILFSDYLTTVSLSKINEIPIKYRKKISYIPNGIDVDSIYRKDGFRYKDLGIEKGKYLLFACGRLDKTKGLHHLIKAYFNLGKNIKLLVIGDFMHDSSYSNYIINLAKKDENIILFKKLLPKDILFDVILNSKLFIFPSEIEAMSMILLEVISLKIPIVCSDIPENIEIVGEKYKYLFKTKDSNDLLNKINKALNDEKISDLSEELYKKIESKFNWREISSKYKNVYYRLYQN